MYRYFLWLFLAASLLVLACSSRAADRTQEPSLTPGVANRDQDSQVSAVPEAPAGQRPSGTAEVEIVTEEPVTITEEPVIATEEPVVVTEEPLTVTEEPVVVTQEPMAVTEEPETRAETSHPGVVVTDEEVCGWEITFEDDFEGDSLDTSRWDPDYGAGEKEAQHYVDDVFELEDDILKIRAERRQVHERQFASGILTTRDIFDQRYGRFEIRAKVPAGQGLWPAFWLLPSSRNYPWEIDVFEILGDETDTVYMSAHWPDDSGEHAFKTRGFRGPDFSEDFHVFEIVWTPDRIVWLVDGFERARETGRIPDEPMFMLLNLAVGGEWPGYPDDSTPFPSYLEVDYVRAYEWTCIEGKLQD